MNIHEFEKIGFEHCIFFNPQNMEFRKEVRDMCQTGKCRLFDRSWACPPACGTIEESIAKASKYSNAVMVQTTAQMEDSFDVETMRSAEKDHKSRFKKAVMAVREEDPGCLPMSAGGCTVCEKCTYPDEPCRFPEQAFTSMEAYGLVVADECKKAGLEYNYGNNTLTYTSCILFN